MGAMLNFTCLAHPYCHSSGTTDELAKQPEKQRMQIDKCHITLNLVYVHQELYLTYMSDVGYFGTSLTKISGFFFF